MLTARHRAVLRVIMERQAQDGVCPSYQEISDMADLKSKGRVNAIVRQLEQRGYIRRMEGRARAMEVIRMPADAEDRFIPDDDLLRMLSELISGAQVMGTYDETVDLRVDRDLWEAVSREVEDHG